MALFVLLSVFSNVEYDMIWALISFGISYTIIQPDSFMGFIGALLFSFVIDLVAVLLTGLLSRR